MLRFSHHIFYDSKAWDPLQEIQSISHGEKYNTWMDLCYHYLGRHFCFHKHMRNSSSQENKSYFQQSTQKSIQTVIEVRGKHSSFELWILPGIRPLESSSPSQAIRFELQDDFPWKQFFVILYFDAYIFTIKTLYGTISPPLFCCNCNQQIMHLEFWFPNLPWCIDLMDMSTGKHK